MHHVTVCPVCDKGQFELFETVIDHTVSHETFDIIKCQTCGIGITSPQPDVNELSKYYESASYISHTNSKTTIFDKAYQVSRYFTTKWKVNLLHKHLISNTFPESLLDYGCGTGHFLTNAQKSVSHVQGVEPSAAARKIAEDITNQTIHSTLATVTETFDAITMWHVIEHVRNLNETISELADRLNENGTMFIAVPNHESNDAHHYNKHWAGYDVPRHLWHFNKQSMTALLQKHQLKIHEIIPMKLDAFYVSLLSEKYKRQKQTITGTISGTLQGLLSNLKAHKKNYSSLIFVIRK